MQNATFAPHQENVKMDICATCSNLETCDYINLEHKTVWECELYIAEEASNRSLEISKPYTFTGICETGKAGQSLPFVKS